MEIKVIKWKLVKNSDLWSKWWMMQ